MYNDNRIQLNASLKFNPAGELISRDLLINFREQNVEDCSKLLSDFTRKFNLNLGLAESKQLPQPQGQVVVVKHEQPRVEDKPAPRCPKCDVPMQLKFCRKPGRYFNTSFFSCPNWALTGCLEKVAA